MTKLQYALEFLKNNISIIPIYHRNKKPDVSLIGGTWEQFCYDHNTEYQLISWLSSGWLNYGVVCGWNNLVVIDFDLMDYFLLWKLWGSNHKDINAIIDTAFKVRTSRGIHVYVTTADPVCNDKRRGIDVQAQRKFVVGPGCVHPSGAVYEPIGAMVFPMVENIESILPLDLFPRVARDVAAGTMEPIEIASNNTEYSYDPFQQAMFSSHLDLISRVKQLVRIESMFPNARKTSSDGRWLSALCPFHNDTNPSFWIDTRRQLCGCATCLMKPMDVLNLYARMHNISDSAAVTALANEIGIWR